MYDPTKHVNARSTPQTERTVGRADEVKNSAGGFVFKVDLWTRLRRFLILGSEGGTYYVGERELTQDNAQAVVACIKADGPRVVREIMAVSGRGLAPKNDPALFALAMAASQRMADNATVKAAFAALPAVARIGTHLFHFVHYMQAFRGWGRAAREAVAAWYNAMPAEKLALQAVKYQQRDGWSHRDLLRLSHPNPPDPEHDALYQWIVNGSFEKCVSLPSEAGLRILEGFSKACVSTSPDEIASLVREYRLPRECVPTQMLGEARVWDALLERMPIEAMVRNLGNMSKVGLLVPMSNAERTVIERLSDPDVVAKARLHPIKLLIALKTYASGHGVRGKGEWTVCPRIVDALDDAFYGAFINVEPTGKRWMLGVDVSASMSWPENILSNCGGLSSAEAAAAMCMVTLKTEQSSYAMGFSGDIVDLGLSPRMRLDEVMRRTRENNAGRTDCALPMMWALQKGVKVDVFVVYTDNETWCGAVKPYQALQHYREKTGIPAKLVVAAFTATDFSIADPTDAGMLDVIGFDGSVPEVMRQFVIG